MKYQCSGCGDVSDTHVYAFTDSTYCIGAALEDVVDYLASAPDWVTNGSGEIVEEPIGCLNCRRMDVTFTVFLPLAHENQAQGGSE